MLWAVARAYGYYAYCLSLVCCHVVAVDILSGFQDCALKLLWILFMCSHAVARVLWVVAKWFLTVLSEKSL